MNYFLSRVGSSRRVNCCIWTYLECWMIPCYKHYEPSCQTLKSTNFIFRVWLGPPLESDALPSGASKFANELCVYVYLILLFFFQFYLTLDCPLDSQFWTLLQNQIKDNCAYSSDLILRHHKSDLSVESNWIW